MSGLWVNFYRTKKYLGVRDEQIYRWIEAGILEVDTKFCNPGEARKSDWVRISTHSIGKLIGKALAHLEEIEKEKKVKKTKIERQLGRLLREIGSLKIEIESLRIKEKEWDSEH